MSVKKHLNITSQVPSYTVHLTFRANTAQLMTDKQNIYIYKTNKIQLKRLYIYIEPYMQRVQRLDFIPFHVSHNNIFGISNSVACPIFIGPFGNISKIYIIQ